MQLTYFIVKASQKGIMGHDFTQLVQVVTLFLLITCVVGVLARGATKAAVVRSVSLDDYLISISLVGSWNLAELGPSDDVQLFAIGQSVAVFVQTTNGFGSPLKASTPSQLETDLKVNASPLSCTNPLVLTFYS